MRSNTQLCKISEGSSNLTLCGGLKTSLWACACHARACEVGKTHGKHRFLSRPCLNREVLLLQFSTLTCLATKRKLRIRPHLCRACSSTFAAKGLSSRARKPRPFLAHRGGIARSPITSGLGLKKCYGTRTSRTRRAWFQAVTDKSRRPRVCHPKDIKEAQSPCRSGLPGSSTIQ